MNEEPIMLSPAEAAKGRAEARKIMRAWALRIVSNIGSAGLTTANADDAIDLLIEGLQDLRAGLR